MQLESLRELLVHELQDLYDAEKQLVKALPKMAKAASFPELKKGFEQHLEQTKGHVNRIEKAFQILGEDAKAKKCKGMAGLVKEGEELIKKENADDATRDAGLISAAQRVEHYEIAAYGTARTYANTLGENDLAELLQTTLDEESETNEKLTKVAEKAVNVEAAAKA